MQICVHKILICALKMLTFVHKVLICKYKMQIGAQKIITFRHKILTCANSIFYFHLQNAYLLAWNANFDKTETCKFVPTKC